jgi:hypothetical protein
MVRGSGQVEREMLRTLRRVLQWFGFWSGPRPPGSWRDPLAPKPAPIKRPPTRRSGAVAVAEPDE